MEKQAVFKMVIDYFKENEDDFVNAIESLDSYNGYLGDDRYFDMEDLIECISVTCGTTKSIRDRNELVEKYLRLIYYGYDAETWHLDAAGDKYYGPFNPNRTYYTYGRNGGYVSTDTREYSDKLDDYFVEELYENCGHLYLPSEVEDLFELIEG